MLSKEYKKYQVPNFLAVSPFQNFIFIYIFDGIFLYNENFFICILKSFFLFLIHFC